jgi:hypothetical protein
MSSSKLVDATTTASTEGPPASPGELPLFEPYDSPVGGWGALQATAKALRGTLIAKEIEKWAKVIKFSGAKPD